MHTILETIVEIRVQVAIIDCRQAVAAFEDAFDRPAAGLHAAQVSSGVVIYHALLLGHPRLRQVDCRVRVNRLIALEIKPQEKRHRRGKMGRLVDQQVQPGGMLVAIKGQAHLLTDRPPVQSALIPLAAPNLHLHRLARGLPIHLPGKQGQDFNPTLAPFCFIPDRSAVGKG